MHHTKYPPSNHHKTRQVINRVRNRSLISYDIYLFIVIHLTYYYLLATYLHQSCFSMYLPFSCPVPCQLQGKVFCLICFCIKIKTFQCQVKMRSNFEGSEQSLITLLITFIMTLVCWMNEWMNEKYILLSFATFIKENNVVCHEIKIKMHNYRIQYMLLKVYPLTIM